MKPAVLLLISIGVLAQETETPHQLLEKVKKLGLSAKTIDQAEPLLDRAIRAWQDNDPRNPEFAEALTMLGMIRQFAAAGDFQTVRANVEPLYRRALTVFNGAATAPDPEHVAATLELEAAALNSIGEVQEATPLAERATAIRIQRIREMQQGEPQAGIAYKPGEGISAPGVIKRVDPAYTNDARFLKIQGTVVLRLVVDENGRSRDVSLVRSLGYGLDEQAVRAVREWRFQPGTATGRGAVPTIVTLEVNFRLD